MLKKIKLFFRILHINFVFIKHGLDQVVLAIPLFKPIRFLAYFNPFMWFDKQPKSHGERIRLALEELGPIFVKFGQALSTRSDLFPDAIIFELAKLQDCVPSFPGTIAQRIVEQELGASIETVFAEFSLTPTASASIAQVHEAQLYNKLLQRDERVAVKILRPNIESVIQRDIELLYAVARIVERYWQAAIRLHPVAVVAEFDKVIHDELDLIKEAANASQLKRNFQNSDELYIPKIYWDYVTEKVLTMEYIEGIPISDIASLKACDINLKTLAESGVNIFFTQVFRDSFFHADMHPGNIFVNPHQTHSPQYMAVDFGIVGSLDPDDQYYLASNMLAFFQRDYRKVALLHIQSGWVASNTRVNELEAAIRSVCEPIFEKPLYEISFAKTLMRLFQISRKFNMEVQPQLMLLQKTLLHVEGLGRSLYPELDLWATAKPFFESWMKKQMGPRALFSKVMEKQSEWLRELPEIPELIYGVLQRINRPVEPNPLALKIKKRSRWKFIFFGSGITFTLIALCFLIWKQALSHLHLNYALTASFFAIVCYIVSFLVRDNL